MKYVFDIDGTICSTSDSHNYVSSLPYYDVISHINALYESGHDITLFTARGSSSGIDWHSLTVSQLVKWRVKYHKLIDKGKPSWDLFVDDKAVNAIEWRKSIKSKIVGFVAGAFDVIHPGYIAMFKQSKERCDHLIVGLHDDPTIERPTKLKPVLSFDERKEILLSIKYIDDVYKYNTEDDLSNLIINLKPNVRFLGEDYINKPITGSNLTQIIFLDRSHGWSTTKFKKLISNSLI